MKIMKPLRLIPAAFVVAALLAMAAFANGASIQAQGTSATPSAMAGMDASHPAHIHNGTCAALGSIAWPLDDVAAPGTAVTMMGTPTAAPTLAANASPMAGMGPVVAQSVTLVKVHLADLEKASFAINVHESLAKITNYIACGDLTGPITNGKLTVPLTELNGSGLAGMATLQDGGDGITTVTIQLMRQTSGGATPPAAQPAATTASDGGQAQNGATVTMMDIAFSPTEFTIDANTGVIVTLTNTGASPHNFSITDHNNPSVKNLGISVDVQPGQTTTVTVNAPAGDYYYFCNVPGHEAAGMHGVLHIK